MMLIPDYAYVLLEIVLFSKKSNSFESTVPKKAPFSRIDILLRVLKYFLIGIKNPDPKKPLVV